MSILDVLLVVTWRLRGSDLAGVTWWLSQDEPRGLLPPSALSSCVNHASPPPLELCGAGASLEGGEHPAPSQVSGQIPLRSLSVTSPWFHITMCAGAPRSPGGGPHSQPLIFALQDENCVHTIKPKPRA